VHQALEEFYPGVIGAVQLVEYKVTTIPNKGTSGTASRVEVLIVSTDGSHFLINLSEVFRLIKFMFFKSARKMSCSPPVRKVKIIG